jgi:ELWxxDGT repeat protein
VGSTVFFTANNGVDGIELWKSDGTQAGTRLVKNIRTGGASSNPESLTALGNTLYFMASDGVAGTELWKSDGTQAGTVLVKDIFPGTSSGAGFWLMAMGTELFFAGNDGTSGLEPWVSDGTEAGTRRYADIHPGAGSSNPERAIELGGLLFFSANDGSKGVELWSTADCIPPKVTCPASVNASATGAAGASIDYAPAAATDNLPGVLLAYSHPSGSTFKAGSTLVTVTATDAANNTDTCSFTVQVDRGNIPPDTKAPHITCPANVTTAASGPEGTSVTYPPATATDDVTAQPTITYDRASGGTLPVGTTTLTATATDEAGNQATCTFSVTVTPKGTSVDVEDGCGCGAGAGSAGPWWAAATLLLMSLRRSVRTRRTRA